MANYYYGYFRSNDISVDPKGQLYKVIIFTGYDGEEDPYPMVMRYTPQHAAGRKYVPDPSRMFELQMADRPFIVDYAGTEPKDTKYKSYVCSTASISFMQSAFNTEFIDASGNKNLVVMLKWKNEIEKVYNDGEHIGYYNPSTNSTLVRPSTSVWWQGFIPQDEDAFCYDIEWVGFVMPDTFSLDFSHIEDKFTLRAQDALSTLQYKKYEYDENKPVVVAVIDTILSLLGKLHIYKKIYITDTIKPAGVNISVLNNIFHQQYNNFDEEDNPLNELEILSNLMTYLNLTMIPVGDNLYITNYNAVATGLNNYKVYSIYPANTGYVGELLPWWNNQYTEIAPEYVSTGYTIYAEDFMSDNSTMSSTTTFNNVSIDIDEYPVDELIPDITSDDNLILMNDETGNNMTHGDYFLSGNDHRWWYWEHKYWIPKADNYYKHAAFETYYYRGQDWEINNRSQGWHYPRIENPTWWTYGNTLMCTPFCCILDNTAMKDGHSENTVSNALKRPYKPGRFMFFNTPVYTTASASDDGRYNPSKGQRWWPGTNQAICKWQTMAYMRTKELVLTKNHYLHLSGTWTFFTGGSVDIQRGIPTVTNISNPSWLNPKEYHSGVNLAWVPMKIKCGDYWLKNNWNYNSEHGGYGQGYIWSKVTDDWNPDHICALYFKLDANDEGELTNPCWGSPWVLENTFPRFGDGWYLPISYHRDMADDELVPTAIEIWFGRPFGVGYGYGGNGVPPTWTTIVEDFNVEVSTYDDIIKAKKNSATSNTQYKTEIDPDAIDEQAPVNLNITTNNEGKPMYSQALYKDTTNSAAKFKIVPRIYNAATTHYMIPESHIVTDNADQYNVSSLIFNTTLKNKFKPLACMKWPSQFPTKTFVLTSCTVDYEYETVDCEMVEFLTPSEQGYDVVRQNTIRNLMRSEDVIMRQENDVARNRQLIINVPYTYASGTFVVDENGFVQLTTSNANVGDFRIECDFEYGDLICSIPDTCENTIDVQLDDANNLKVITQNNQIIVASNNI